MEKYKSIQEFLKAKRKKLKDKYKADDSWIQDDNSKTKKNPGIKTRAAIFERIIKTADHMMPPKEHGTGIYDWKNSLYQNLKKYKSVDRYNKEHKAKYHTDDNDIDFPLDDQINTELAGAFDDTSDNLVGQSNLTGGKLDEYLPKDDFEGKPPTALNFGRDYDETGPGRDHNDILQKLFNKYLTPSETGLFGLPDGVDPDGHDADQTEQVEEPFTGTSDIGTQMYEDKWNI